MLAGGSTLASPSEAQEIGGRVAMLRSASSLIMPFDNTGNHVSFQLVTRVGPGPSEKAPIFTNWTYWSEDGRHLVDASVCLTPLDSKVMDPTRVISEFQDVNPPRNLTPGSSLGRPTTLVDLSGERGFVVVSAFEANNATGQSGCFITDFDAALPSELIGGWVIADTATAAAFGGDAFGLPASGLSDTDHALGALSVASFRPEGLAASSVIVLGIEFPAGAAPFGNSTPGPIPRPRPDGAHVCCAAAFVDALEMELSLPDVCFAGAAFVPISAAQAPPGAATIIPPDVAVASPGILRLRACESATAGGLVAPLGSEIPQLLFAVHGQALGPFGVAVQGKYDTAYARAEEHGLEALLPVTPRRAGTPRIAATRR